MGCRLLPDAPLRDAGFSQVELVRAVRNGRTRSPHVLAAVMRNDARPLVVGRA